MAKVFVTGRRKAEWSNVIIDKAKAARDAGLGPTRDVPPTNAGWVVQENSRVPVVLREHTIASMQKLCDCKRCSKGDVKPWHGIDDIPF